LYVPRNTLGTDVPMLSACNAFLPHLKGSHQPMQKFRSEINQCVMRDNELIVQ